MERKPYLSQLVDDDGVYNIGADLTLDNPLRSASISFYTEPLTRETGCLRVIPGSHRAGSPDLLAPFRSSDRDAEFGPFGVPPSELPCYSYESGPGDVIVFKAQLLHASFGSRVDRHMYLIAFLGDPKTEEETAVFHALYEKDRYFLHAAEFHANSDRPRIGCMVSRLVEWGFETSKV